MLLHPSFSYSQLEDMSKGRVTVPPNAIMAASNTATFCTGLIGGAVQQL